MTKLSIFSFLLCFITEISFARTINLPLPLKGIEKVYDKEMLKDKVIIFEWFNKGCPFVKKFYHSNVMQTFQKKYAGKKSFIWFSVISSAPGKQGHETKEQAKTTREELKISSSDTILDPKGTLGKFFGAVTTPHFFILKNNKVLYEGAIDSIPNTEEEDIPKAINYVELALSSVEKNVAIKIKKTKAYGCSIKY